MSELDSLYQQIILDHSKARQGSGLATEPAPVGARLGESHQINTTCGDEVTVRVAVVDGKIEQIRWDGDGCAISMAAASVISELGEGEGVGELRAKIETFRELMRSRGTVEADEDVLGDAAAFSGVSKYPARVKCAMLAWVAVEHALAEAEA
ncbi:Fe-S cluster assembly sulfur transfer protein SufU [Lacisediminihabitans profunda]|uniref:SUF system NifU family Fe-S cluster assembly protein n=1 Tax=Lacisediminihabitans profunda TaxID=2594790 RepID=A0A5C8UUD1_9MICO|nr:SUF system NifU family Fe-S cluster assembly protein [Lacisediminihabitans profunda]TXN31246.1 SUF system NifU family Fe-S cluster assembly protein [Lacisediminihabitans profunda]